MPMRILSTFGRWLPAVAATVGLALILAACEHGAAYAFRHDPNVVNLTKATFPEQVLSSSQPVVVDFWAEWCGPCKALAPVVSQLAMEYSGRVKFGKVDVDREEALVDQYEVEGFPTLLIFKDGKVVNRSLGLVEKKELQDKLNELLGSTPAAKPSAGAQ